MANPRWSSSRFSSFNGCKTSYKLSYIDELVVVGKEVEVQAKGLAFHEIAEAMTSKKTLKQLNKLAEQKLEGYNFDKEKYPVIKAIPRFHMWWNEYIKKWEADGFNIEKEKWEYSALNGKSIVGAIDLLLTNETTKEAIIIDYKSAATAKLDGYENQLMLYAYMIKNKLKTKYDKIKTYVFFPLAFLKDDDGTDAEKTHKLMLKSFKQLVFTEEEVKNTLDSFKDIITNSDAENWENFDYKSNATISFACNWCAFNGHPKYCPVTYEKGFRFPRKCKIMTKKELKKLQEEEKKETK